MPRHEGAEMEHNSPEAFKENIALKSKNTREDMPGGDTWIEVPETSEKFVAERIESHKDPRVRGSHELLKQTFGRNEVDSLRTTEAAMRGVVVGDEASEDTPLLVHAIENEKKEVVATAHTAVLESYNDDFEAKRGGKAFMLDAYTVVRPGDQNKDLGYELYRKRVDDAAKHAAERGLKMESAVAEVTPEGPEHFYNQVGLSRMYMENKQGQLIEVPYYQSVLADAWDEATGHPREGEMKSALHLMVGQLDGNKELTPEQVLEKVRALMDYDSFQTKGYFKNGKAHKNHEAALEKDLAEFEKALGQAADGKIKLMTAEERDEWSRSHGANKAVSHVPPPEKK